MKKLYFLALSMLLSTAYIAQASNDESKGQKRPRKNRSQQEQKTPRVDSPERQQEAVDAIGSPLSDALIASYATQLSSVIGSLSAESTNEEVKEALVMSRHIRVALRQLHPKIASEETEEATV